MERVVKPDGRYVLYYSWPPESEPSDEPAKPELRRGSDSTATTPSDPEAPGPQRRPDV